MQVFLRHIVNAAWQCISACQGGWFGVSVNPGGLRGVQIREMFCLTPSIARTDHEATVH